jgi:hypothetical protein
MLNSAAGLAGVVVVTENPPRDPAPERRAEPQWFEQRLFGGGRHPGAFTAGVEKRADL